MRRGRTAAVQAAKSGCPPLAEFSGGYLHPVAGVQGANADTQRQRPPRVSPACLPACLAAPIQPPSALTGSAAPTPFARPPASVLDPGVWGDPPHAGHGQVPDGAGDGEGRGVGLPQGEGARPVSLPSDPSPTDSSHSARLTVAAPEPCASPKPTPPAPAHRFSLPTDEQGRAGRAVRRARGARGGRVRHFRDGGRDGVRGDGAGWEPHEAVHRPGGLRGGAGGLSARLACQLAVPTLSLPPHPLARTAREMDEFVLRPPSSPRPRRNRRRGSRRRRAGRSRRSRGTGWRTCPTGGTQTYPGRRASPNTTWCSSSSGSSGGGSASRRGRGKARPPGFGRPCLPRAESGVAWFRLLSGWRRRGR